MSEGKKVGIHYGALARPLNVQLDEQNVRYSEERISYFQELLESLIKLRFGGILIDSQYEKCLKKFHNKLIRYLDGAQLQPLAKKEKTP